MTVDVSPHGDHDAALRELLLQQVRTTRTTETPTRDQQRRLMGGHPWRPLVVTGVVAVAVALIGLAAINLHLPGRSAPAHYSGQILPTPSGRIVKTLSDAIGGNTQTFALNTSGSAFKILLACTGGGDTSQLRLHIPQHSDSAIGCGQGLNSGGDTVDANTGTIPITVTATDSSTHWRVDFITTAPTARDYTYPTEHAADVVDPLGDITDPSRTEQFRSEYPNVLLHATGNDEITHTATLRFPPGATTLRTGSSAPTAGGRICDRT